MKQTILKQKNYNYEEFLEIEKTSKLRYEYYYGELYSMAGTSIIHNDLIFNVTLSFKNKLKNKNCKVNFENIKVRIEEKKHYTYPDIVVSCSEKENDLYTIKYPIAIVEVLSDSTRTYDTQKKFDFYKKIPSMMHYILVEQNYCYVCCYTRKNDLWYYNSYSNENEFINLEYLKIKIPIKEIYENIKFANKNFRLKI